MSAYAGILRLGFGFDACGDGFGLEFAVLRNAIEDVAVLVDYYDAVISKWADNRDRFYKRKLNRTRKNRIVVNGIGSLAWIICEDDIGGSKLAFNEICDMLNATPNIIRERTLRENKISPKLAHFIKDWITGD